MKNRGFTLIELLLAVIILTIVSTIAISSVTYISKSVRQNERSNLIKNIEIQASNYAFKYSSDSTIVVDELIQEGLIDADDKDGNLYDPVDHTRLNCYYVHITKVGNHYEATFEDNFNGDTDGICDNNQIK